jgi:hypothetical protein
MARICTRSAECDVALFQTSKAPIKISIRVVRGETVYEADLEESAIVYDPVCVYPAIYEIFKSTPRASFTDSHAILNWLIELPNMNCTIKIKVPRAG